MENLSVADAAPARAWPPLKFVAVEASASAEPAQFAGATLLLPAVTIGNVGQLTVDLIVATLGVPRVGYFDTELVLPIAGHGAFSPPFRASQGLAGALSLPLELFHDERRNLLLVQQRSPVVAGGQAAWADALVAWAKEAGAARLLVLGSAPAHHRRDAQIQDGMLRAVPNACWAEALDPRLCLALEEELRVASDSRGSTGAAWRPRASSALMVGASQAAALPCLALIHFCAEGNNAADALHMAEALRRSGTIAVSGEGEGGAGEEHPPIQWVSPECWAQMEGSRPDGSIY